MQLDETDRRIIRLLSEDARRTNADVAARVNLSRAAVKRRIDRLEQLGVIAGYTVVLDHGKLGPAIEAFAELRISGDRDADELLAVVRQLPAVHEVFTTAGDPDVLIRIRVDDAAHLKQVVNGLRRSGSVTGTKTLIVLDRWSRTGDVGAGPPPG